MNDDKSIIFLDRDGTINIDHGYVTSPERVELIKGAAEAIAAFKKAGYLVVIVTNQSAIGRGMATKEEVDATNEELCRQLQALNLNATIDLIVYSPDTPQNATDTRKPGIGLLREVKKHWNISLETSWMIGDKLSDINFGLNANIPHKQCALVLTGEGEKSLQKWKGNNNLVTFKNLLEASQFILRNRP